MKYKNINCEGIYSKTEKMDRKKIIDDLKPNQHRKKVDLDRIETLYKTYQDRKKKINNIQSNWDIEKGYTYRPTFLSTNKEINGKLKKKYGNLPITERSKKFIDDKNDFIYQQNEEHFAYQKPKRIYTEKEKEEITQNIIKRLYEQGVQKQLNRNQIYNFNNENEYFQRKTEENKNDNSKENFKITENVKMEDKESPINSMPDNKPNIDDVEGYAKIESNQEIHIPTNENIIIIEEHKENNN